MWRCELCDCYLRFLQTGYLCDICYKIRLITKCYNAEEILKCVEENFKIKENKWNIKTIQLEKLKQNINANDLKTIILRKTIPLPKECEATHKETIPTNKQSVSSVDEEEGFTQVKTRNKKNLLKR